MSDLKPCPFCGGKVVIYQNYNNYGIWSISCDACHVEMVSGVREVLVASWNTRPIEDAPPKKRKELTEIINDLSAANVRIARILEVVKEKNNRLITEVRQLKGIKK